LIKSAKTRSDSKTEELIEKLIEKENRNVIKIINKKVK